MPKLKIDFNNILESNVGEHGIAQAEIEQYARLVPKVHEGVCAKRNMNAWRELPHNQQEIVAQILQTAEQIRKRFDAFVVFGIGGSALGTKALFSALKHPRYNELDAQKRGGPKLYVLDNVDPDSLHALFDVIDIRKTAFNIITKSGNTVETMSQFMVVLSKLHELGEDLREHIFLTTDKQKGILRKIADQHGFQTFIVPDGVGGRFSVLSPVGLLPAAVVGIDIQALLEGAAQMHEVCQKASLRENPAYMYALLHVIAMKKGVNISVMMPYADSLLCTAEWYAQLWAESLGKRNDVHGRTVHTGQTPVRALGVTDQHSQVQLYNEGPFDKIITFITVENYRTQMQIPASPVEMKETEYLAGQSFNKLIASEQAATEYAVTSAGKMNMRIALERVEEESIGALLFFLEMATAAAGEFLEIDAFDQPGVEAGKVATFALMGREGYESKARELSQKKPADPAFCYEL